jgi:hypothetical protein
VSFVVVVASVVAVCALALTMMWRLSQRRVRAAEESARVANERRDRFFLSAAAELEAPLAAGRVDEARRLLQELAHPVLKADAFSSVQLDQLLREIVEAPPFSDHGPAVILRAQPVHVRADRARLANGLRLLLWTLRREADPESPLVLTVRTLDPEHALIEMETSGTAMTVVALERSAGVMAGVTEPAGPPGATLAMRVAAEVARVHGGRLSARAVAGQGERFVLELPA